ncbi:hypothetical protein Mal4_51180 [Maioricimonas rarisocia]|uniref:Uncharacterized protein n=1 Tax=Maioricimonas rarisocia TaxID=2528026 RepID=A0A517ZE52_9PLAN|nr:hypothetical protein [Maioricimonas rarisocia]QDU40758.1 hypothetical protein Mal4_51180 [Maioricimonas rarisocia]
MNPILDSSGRPISSEPRPATIRNLSAGSKATLLCGAAVLTALSTAVSNVENIRSFFAEDAAVLVVDDMDVVDDSPFPYVDLIVRNVGSKVASITRVELTVDELVTSDEEFAMGHVPADVEYHVVIPVHDGLPATGVDESAGRKVAPDDVDRVRIRYRLDDGAADFMSGSFGADTELPPYVVAFRISATVTYNGSQTVTAGPIVANNNSLQFFGQLAWSGPKERKAFEKIIADVENLDGEKSLSTGRVVKLVHLTLEKLKATDEAVPEDVASPDEVDVPDDRSRPPDPTLP